MERGFLSDHTQTRWILIAALTSSLCMPDGISLIKKLFFTLLLLSEHVPIDCWCTNDVTTPGVFGQGFFG